MDDWVVLADLSAKGGSAGSEAPSCGGWTNQGAAMQGHSGEMRDAMQWTKGYSTRIGCVDWARRGESLELGKGVCGRFLIPPSGPSLSPPSLHSSMSTVDSAEEQLCRPSGR